MPEVWIVRTDIKDDKSDELMFVGCCTKECREWIEINSWILDIQAGSERYTFEIREEDK